MSLPIDLTASTELLGRFHRTLMDRQASPPLEQLDASKYPDELVEHARQQWAGRAVAEYQSTAQFSELLHRLCIWGAPIELIGAATRLATDECRHAELCARVADRLGGRHGHEVSEEGLSLYAEEADPLLAIYRTILSVCCFGETLSIPMLEAIEVVATDPICEQVAGVIAADETYHAHFGWEALELLDDRLEEEQRAQLQARLPGLFAHFEAACCGGLEALEALAETEVVIEPGDPDEPNLGTLTDMQYAAIFYHVIETRLMPGLESLGFDPVQAWHERPR